MQRLLLIVGSLAGIAASLAIYQYAATNSGTSFAAAMAELFGGYGLFGASVAAIVYTLTPRVVRFEVMFAGAFTAIIFTVKPFENDALTGFTIAAAALSAFGLLFASSLSEELA